VGLLDLLIFLTIIIIIIIIIHTSSLYRGGEVDRNNSSTLAKRSSIDRPINELHRRATGRVSLAIWDPS